jgi:hypothetical protein
LLVSVSWYVCWIQFRCNVQINDVPHCHEPSVSATLISSRSALSGISTPAIGSDILDTQFIAAGSNIPATHASSSGIDSFEFLAQLGIPTHMADYNDRGLLIAYKKHKAYLTACCVYQAKVADGSWSGNKLTGADLIQLFISKSFWHSHYKPLFSKASNYPDMLKWLDGEKDRLSDEDLWGCYDSPADILRSE